MSSRKTLAEQLAELQQPDKEVDIESVEFAPLPDSDASLDNDSDHGKDHYVQTGRSKLRDGIVRDKKYTGGKVDRSKLFENNLDGGLDSEEEEESEGEFDSAANSANEDASEGSESEQAGGFDGESGEDSEGEGSSEGESGSNTEGESESVSSENETRSASRIKDIMAAERKLLVKRLSQAAADDALKGHAILQQHKQFDALIDARLKIQKAVVDSNLLPPRKAKADPKAVTRARGACHTLLTSIRRLQLALMSREGLEVPQTPSHEHTLAAASKWCEQADASIAAQRTAVLTKWLAKIQNTSGAGALGAGKFRALNQSAEQQVENNLADMPRLLKRTRLNRRNIVPLGEKEDESSDHESDAANPEDDPEEDDTEDKKKRKLTIGERALIFDDEDFYRVLLNDLVDKKIQLSDPTSGLQFALRGAASTKLKRAVDNKASKGRKLRYHVQEPIANFDMPRKWVSWTDNQIDEFFASLLGQKISMKEDESESEAEEDNVTVDAGSIRLFG